MLSASSGVMGAAGLAPWLSTPIAVRRSDQRIKSVRLVGRTIKGGLRWFAQPVGDRAAMQKLI